MHLCLIPISPASKSNNLLLKTPSLEVGREATDNLASSVGKSPKLAPKVKELIKQPNGSYMAGAEEESEPSPRTGRRSERRGWLSNLIQFCHLHHLNMNLFFSRSEKQPRTPSPNGDPGMFCHSLFVVGANSKHEFENAGHIWPAQPLTKKLSRRHLGG